LFDLRVFMPGNRPAINTFQVEIAKFTLENGKNALEINKNRLEIVNFTLENAENVLENAEFRVEIAEFTLENGKNTLEIAEFTLEIANFESELAVYHGKKPGRPRRQNRKETGPARIRFSDFVSWPQSLERMHLLRLPPFSEYVQQLAQCRCLRRVIGRAIASVAVRHPIGTISVTEDHQ
jgi:hypothetical protein